MKYRKKPLVVEAVKIDKDNTEELETLIDTNNSSEDICCYYRSLYGIAEIYMVKIKTLEGTMVANVGDYIIKGIKGEFYPCKPNIFEATYEKVEG